MSHCLNAETRASYVGRHSNFVIPLITCNMFRVQFAPNSGTIQWMKKATGTDLKYQS